MPLGQVKNINLNRGIGFIKYKDKEYFFRTRDKDNRYVPEKDEEVFFDIKEDRNGRLSATKLAPKSNEYWRFINPYNFIRYEGSINRENGYTSHHQFIDFKGRKDLHSGYIYCKLKIKTPLFIPDPDKTKYRSLTEVILPDGFTWDGDSVEIIFEKNKDGPIKVLRKVSEEQGFQDDQHIFESLNKLKEGVLKGRGILYKEQGGEKDYYIVTSMPLEKSHKIMEFFRIHNNPVIPPASLKGMVRSLAEAVSNSCFSQTSLKRLCHRQVNLGSRAVPAIVLCKPEDKEDGKIGLLDEINKSNHAWVPAYQQSKLIQNSDKTGDPVCVTINDVRHHRGNWKYYKVVEKQDSINNLLGEQEERYQGILYITGYNVEGKHDERVFFSDRYKTDLGDRYKEFCKGPGQWQVYLGDLTQVEFSYSHQNDYNDLREEQKDRQKAVQEPGPGGRRIKHTKLQHEDLSVGDLVYAYFDDGKNLIGLSPVLVPLFWDKKKPSDLLGDFAPCCNVNSLCPCCSLFGMVSGSQTGGSLAGKISFSKANWDNNKVPEWYTKILHILGSPHPTCEQFYLIDKSRKKSVAHYDDRFGKITGELRGRKMYFHHTKWVDANVFAEKPNWMNSTVELLKSGSFNFTVDFQNLTDYELGLLLYSLELEGSDSSLCHKLGMGKPLGLGSVKIIIDKLCLIDREQRYCSILSSGVYKELNYKEKFIKGFKKVQAKEQSDDMETIEKAFSGLPYIQDLEVMMDYKDFDGIEIKYPRAKSRRDGNPYGYEWFQQNKLKPLPTVQDVNENEKMLDGWS